MASSGKLIHLNWGKMHTDLFAVETPRCLHPMKSSQVLITQGRNDEMEFTISTKTNMFLLLASQEKIILVECLIFFIQPWH